MTHSRAIEILEAMAQRERDLGNNEYEQALKIALRIIQRRPLPQADGGTNE